MLGDLVASALAAVGITEQLVHRWFGGCCCAERRAKLNALDAWARRTLADKKDEAVRHLRQILGD